MRDKKNFFHARKNRRKICRRSGILFRFRDGKSEGKAKKARFCRAYFGRGGRRLRRMRGDFVFSRFFSGMKSAGGADNMATAPEAGDTVDKSEDGAADISSASGESQVDSEDSDSSDSSSESGTEEDN